MDKKILIIDDELEVRNLFYDIFTKEGYEVVTIAGGEESIKAVKKEKPDLVLLDFNMPNINGIEILKEIRKEDTKTKIVMLTAVGSEDLEKEARLLGASGFLRKSLGIEVIVKSVNNIFGIKKEYAENKILVVDDDEELISLIRDFLVRKGYVVSVAKKGEEALEKFKKERPILILLDVRLPGMDGIVVLKKIREIDDKVGVIMITGIKDEEVLEEARRLGAYEYITKPFELDYLETCVLVRISLVSAQIS